MEALVEDEAIASARFYCTHCNLYFGEIEHLEGHIAEVTNYRQEVLLAQHQPATDEGPSEPKTQRRRAATQKKTTIQLPEEEVTKVVESQPAKDASLSERMLYAVSGFILYIVLCYLLFYTK